MCGPFSSQPIDVGLMAHILPRHGETAVFRKASRERWHGVQYRLRHVEHVLRKINELHSDSRTEAWIEDADENVIDKRALKK
jgi:hypothetical protein